MAKDPTMYGYSLEIHQAAERIIERDIYANQTSLVDDSLMKDLFDYDDIFNPCDTEGEYHEIFQWFLVSEWLSDKLREAHEPVLSNEYGIWWGRTCYGQSIILDGTIQCIVMLM